MALFAVAIVVLRRVLTAYRLVDIVASLRRIGWKYGLVSLGLTVLGYAALVGYDYLSLRLARHPISIRRMWSASFVSHAVQNSAPVSIVAGGGLRYRLFSRLGVTGSETAAVVAGNLLTFVIGLFAVAGLCFVLSPIPIPASFHRPVRSLQPVGIAFLVLVIASLIASELGVGKLHIWRWTLDLPRGSMLREQLGVSVADWLLSSLALYVLMIAGGPVSFPRFLSAFLLAQIVTQVVPLPGGIGVFEAAMLLMRPPGLHAPLATAALLVYRVIYYFIPLCAATGILAIEASRGETRASTNSAVRLARDHAASVRGAGIHRRRDPPGVQHTSEYPAVIRLAGTPAATGRGRRFVLHRLAGGGRDCCCSRSAWSEDFESPSNYRGTPAPRHSRGIAARRGPDQCGPAARAPGLAELRRAANSIARFRSARNRSLRDGSPPS